MIIPCYDTRTICIAKWEIYYELSEDKPRSAFSCDIHLADILLAYMIDNDLVVARLERVEED